MLNCTEITDLREVPVIDVFDEPDGRLELLGELRKNHFVKNRMLHLKKPDGTPLFVTVTALAEFDENQNVVFINEFVQDISGFADQRAAQLRSL